GYRQCRRLRGNRHPLGPAVGSDLPQRGDLFGGRHAWPVYGELFDRRARQLHAWRRRTVRNCKTFGPPRRAAGRVEGTYPKTGGGKRRSFISFRMTSRERSHVVSNKQSFPIQTVAGSKGGGSRESERIRQRPRTCDRLRRDPIVDDGCNRAIG